MKKKICLGGLIGVSVLSFGSWFFIWHKPATLNLFLDRTFIQSALFSSHTPEVLTSLGLVDNTIIDFHSGRLGDYTETAENEEIIWLRKVREELNSYGPAGLNDQDLLSWKTMAWFLDIEISEAELGFKGYRITQLDGVTIRIPQLLTENHAIVNARSIERYVNRIADFGRVLSEVQTRIEADQKKGIVAPDFVLEKALVGMRSFISDGAAENILTTSLVEKIEAIDLAAQDAEAYRDAAIHAVEAEVIPGYQAIIKLFENQLAISNHEAGVWRFPNGTGIYAVALKSNTSTDMTADKIHNIGLSEVERIANEMDAILQAQGLAEGSVGSRLQTLMALPEQLFANTDKGRLAMIDYLQEIDRKMTDKASGFFDDFPNQPLEIKRVPIHSENSSPAGYYTPPSLDGKRSGAFYINQKDTSDNPKWTLPTLMYHEGSPGHHFQISKAMSLEGLPIIRTLPLFLAYAEGWALYAERIAQTDMGMYDDDPLGDLGRLQAEIFRAVRLVVDTGIHAKRWSRERAIDYMTSKTGMTNADVTREIERYAVWPGQATAYKIGQMKFLSLRETAEKKLGDFFDLREFHNVILKNGALPLSLLDEVVDRWLSEKLRGQQPEI
jgi:uncharacterized protein (DUF885 family)